MRYKVEEIRRGFDMRRKSREGRGARVRESGRDIIRGRVGKKAKTREKRHTRRKLNLGLQFQQCPHYLAKCPRSVQGSSLLVHKPGPFRGIPFLFLSAQVSQAGNEHDHVELGL